MKALFLTPTSLSEYSGIDKKVLSQYKALKNNGLDIELCYINRSENIIERKIFQKDILLKKINYKNKLLKRIKSILLRWCFKDVENYIFKNQIKFIYIRYEFASNYGFIKFLKNLKKKDIKILIEIPTYPYDQELLNRNLQLRLRFFIDKYYRKNLREYVDKIITFSNDKEIYGISTINISNGIDLEKIEILKKNKSKKIRFIGVAGLSFWHGFDRFILSLKKYYENKYKEEIIFNIVGEGDKKYLNKLEKLVKENKLEKYVIFHGVKSGEELDEIYNNSDIALSSLGEYRRGLKKACILKVREYCAKGIPFILGYEDDDFQEELPFYYKVTNDDSLLDIEEIVRWYKNLKILPEEIRKYAEENLSWNIKMKKVIEEIKKGDNECK